LDGEPCKEFAFWRRPNFSDEFEICQHCSNKLRVVGQFCCEFSIQLKIPVDAGKKLQVVMATAGPHASIPGRASWMVMGRDAESAVGGTELPRIRGCAMERCRNRDTIVF
jgi:hypothetical protein